MDIKIRCISCGEDLEKKEEEREEEIVRHGKTARKVEKGGW